MSARFQCSRPQSRHVLDSVQLNVALRIQSPCRIEVEYGQWESDVNEMLKFMLMISALHFLDEQTTQM